MKNIRTDLALEARELWQEGAKEKTKLEGVVAREMKINGFDVQRVEIIDEQGERELGKPRGLYTTVELTGLKHRDNDVFPRAIETVAGELSRMVPDGNGSILVVGLGNRSITPDAVGTCSVEHVMITRHLVERLPDLFGKMRQVSAIAPGVLGTTGVESLEIIRGVKDHINPDCIIVIDALSSRKLSRLCKTVQITDTGIIPGSGVGNTRSAINKDTLGVPVIAIGVPTVVDIATIVLDIAEDSGVSFPEKAIREYSRTLMVTPKEIDVHIVDVGRIIGYAINTVFQKGVTVSEMDMFLS